MSRPLRFLFLATFYPPYSFGGDAMYTYRLAHALGDAGHQVNVIHSVDTYHLYHPAQPPDYFPDHPNVVRHELRSHFGTLASLITHQTGRPYLTQRQIRTVFDRQYYDVVHYHNISLLGPSVLTMEPHRGTTVKLYTAHDHWLICPTHVLWKFGSRVCEKPECLRCVIRAKRPPQLWRYSSLLADAIQHVDEVVAPSQFTVRMHADRGFPRPITHLPYFMDRVDRDWQQPDPRPQERPYFLFAGRLETIKGLHTLIDLWDRAPDVDLLVAGTGGEEEHLHARAASNPRIKFLGHRAQHELGALYVHALACLVPSVTYETFGMVTIEGFSRKTPVIARHLGPLPEIVELSGGGVTYSTDAELLDALHRFAASPTLVRESGERGYRAFIQHWSREAHLDRYFDLVRRAAVTKFGSAPWETGDPTSRELVEHH